MFALNPVCRATISTPTDTSAAAPTTNLVRCTEAWSLAAWASTSKMTRRGRASLFKQRGELVAVGAAPRLRVEREEQANHASPPSLSCPAATIRDQLANWLASAACPVAVIR